MTKKGLRVLRGRVCWYAADTLFLARFLFLLEGFYPFLPTVHPFVVALRILSFFSYFFGQTPGSQTGCGPRVLPSRTRRKKEDKNPSFGAPAGVLRIGSVTCQSLPLHIALLFLSLVCREREIEKKINLPQSILLVLRLCAVPPLAAGSHIIALIFSIAAGLKCTKYYTSAVAVCWRNHTNYRYHTSYYDNTRFWPRTADPAMVPFFCAFGRESQPPGEARFFGYPFCCQNP